MTGNTTGTGTGIGSGTVTETLYVGESETGTWSGRRGVG